MGGTDVAEVDATSEAVEMGWKDLPLQVETGLTNPVPFKFSEHPQVVAVDGKHTAESAAELPVPGGISGRFTAPQQSHLFRFSAKKGEYYRFDVMSNRIGLPLDAVVEVQDTNGKKLTEADDGLQTKDPTLNFKAPADADYFVQIRDLHDRGGDRFQYHLTAEPSGPDFEVHGEYYYSQIAPGTRMAWFVKLKRLNGFDGPVEILVEDLPAGVTYETCNDSVRDESLFAQSCRRQ